MQFKLVSLGDWKTQKIQARIMSADKGPNAPENVNQSIPSKGIIYTTTRQEPVAPVVPRLPSGSQVLASM